MAHQTQVLVLPHLHLRQAGEIWAQSDEIKRLSTLLEKQQTLLEQVQETQKQVNVSSAQRAQPSTSRLSELQQEAFQYLPGTVNARCGTGIQHLSGISQNIPVAGRQHFEDELAEEATWGSNHPCHVHFAGSDKGGFTSTPLKSTAKLVRTTACSPNKIKPDKISSRVQLAHLNIACRWLHMNSASQRLIN